MDTFGRINILVNKARVGDNGRSLEPEDFDLEASKVYAVEMMAKLVESAAIVHLDEETWDEVFENNLKSCLLCSKAVPPIMIIRKKATSSIFPRSGPLSGERGL